MNHDERTGFEPGTASSYRLAAERMRCRAYVIPDDRKRMLLVASDLDHVADVLDSLPSDILSHLDVSGGDGMSGCLRPTSPH